uniref:Uncharacterized protein n=1 Tax=Escherichia coli TaxID=562 RepID=A0A8F1IER9_ECOLX|nr:abortive infection protein [Escherichia coli]QWP89202.1 hypothetical protein IHCLGBEB_00005 [Escherichia coli]
MKNLLDTEGTVLFPFQTEIHFIGLIFSTPIKRTVIRQGTILPESNTGAPVSVFCFCLALFRSLITVVWFVVPWLKVFIVSKFAVSALWSLTPVKRGLLWGIDKNSGYRRAEDSLLK